VGSFLTRPAHREGCMRAWGGIRSARRGAVALFGANSLDSMRKLCDWSRFHKQAFLALFGIEGLNRDSRC